jgi:hypothetical protein
MIRKNPMSRSPNTERVSHFKSQKEEVIPGPISMNIGNRVAFVKKINRENTTINNRLNSIRSVVPEADKLVSDD